ncbi:hypothetical protein ILYODFUR_030050 [Ilyodon furcidens]|uniref:Uncharacterized protein n=1 Tax=Ilyodon furcidens TaxID=33524 RepID=A0ABV0T3Q6_9TELE
MPSPPSPPHLCGGDVCPLPDEASQESVVWPEKRAKADGWHTEVLMAGMLARCRSGEINLHSFILCGNRGQGCSSLILHHHFRHLSIFIFSLSSCFIFLLKSCFISADNKSSKKNIFTELANKDLHLEIKTNI